MMLEGEFMRVKAVLFDLYGTLIYVEGEVSDRETSDFLFSCGYEISPQQLKAAWYFVAMVDYPKYGFADLDSFLMQMFWRLGVEVDNETFGEFKELCKKSRQKLYPEVEDVLSKVKDHGFKTAIVTTTAHFFFEETLRPIEKYFDFICTGNEAGCDKSNPKMYIKVLDVLNTKPGETVVIGDNLQYDVLLPKKLGMHAILLDRKGGKRKQEASDAVVKDLREAIEMLLNRFK